MAKRKTVGILGLIEQVNIYNEESRDDHKAIRIGQNNLLESILYDAGVYSGYGHYNNLHLGPDKTPGVHYNENGILPDEQRFENTDDSRRYYYINPYLLK